MTPLQLYEYLESISKLNRQEYFKLAIEYISPLLKAEERSTKNILEILNLLEMFRYEPN